MTEQDNDQDPQIRKFFNPKEYSTLFVHIDGDSSYNEDKVTNLVNLLTDPANKPDRREVLDLLRSNAKTSVPMLVQAIKDPETKGQRQALVSACWEADLDCSPYLLLFTELAIKEDYFVALEAVTVIENMPGPFKPEEVPASINKLESFLKTNTSEKAPLLSDLLALLKSFP